MLRGKCCIDALVRMDGGIFTGSPSVEPWLDIPDGRIRMRQDHIGLKAAWSSRHGISSSSPSLVGWRPSAVGKSHLALPLPCARDKERQVTSAQPDSKQTYTGPWLDERAQLRYSASPSYNSMRARLLAARYNMTPQRPDASLAGNGRLRNGRPACRFCCRLEMEALARSRLCSFGRWLRPHGAEPPV